MAASLLQDTSSRLQMPYPSLLCQAVSGRCNTLLTSVARPKQFPICSLLVL